ncbi:uncharacterized protein F4812DRAFT_277847 [Daldinia caldariorum]|uniref:uncharacterized protein n=1 Tax=Daldinia caldariorum TaxID=326644 RepID=UPI002007DB8A|nr:uncharacterized protein F4812DRAFT_277847 [Daldinia caldariorum]KAI1470765.1 hypothetical protein F4812DRAFT_277847 [Daldinia caldariorum]
MNYSFGTTPMFASAILKASRVTAGIRYLILVTAWTRFATLGVAQTLPLPYFPTSIFIPEPKPPPAQDNATINVAYIFSPQGDWVNLLALNFSGNLRASSLPLQTLSSNVPFLDTKNTAFIPSLADNGSLIVYAGDCSSPASSEIWTFNPSPNDGASSSWIKASTTLATKADNVQVGPSFLGTGFSFSNTLAPVLSPANTYVYGGMCPNATAIGTSAQQKATYSNQMIKIAPSATDAGDFTVGPISSDGPPVPEAGFTFTGLSPSVSNRTGILTQQINYVLLGGHTETAFINMSTVAIWSLPEESWNFISDISVGSSGSNTELAVKSNDIDKIDSRSGHTAVLSEDGTSLIVLGGWVGDLTQAASPQLAILNIGTSYGGNGEWHWSVPDVQPPGPGLYGHGAALLPGNIMMVYGGYNISPSETTAKRQASGSNNLPMFLNLTSMSWSNDYTNPDFSGSNTDDSSSGGDSDVGTRLGIGLGVGLGFVAIIIAILLFLLYRRRKRHTRAIRDSAIRALAQDTSRFLPHDDEMMEQDHPGGVWYTGGPDPYLRGNRSLGYQSLRASADNGPQPSWYGGTPPARKPLPRRNTYDPPSGVIHPIIEADEDAHDGDITSEPVSPVRDVSNTTDGRRDSDPFLTPTTQENPISFPPSNRASITPSPEERRLTTDPEVQDWMTDVEAMDALLSSRAAPRMSACASGQQNSPARRGPDDSRTESSVSETNRSSLGVSRSESVRSVLRSGLGIAAAALGASSSAPAPAAAAPANDENRGGSSGSSSSAPSYNTARSSFAALQAEGPVLLMGRVSRDEYEAAPGSPSKNKPRRSWLGSLRRVLNGGASPPETPDREKQLDDEGFAAGANGYDMPRGGGLSEIAAGGLLRRKSGRGDWEGMGERYDGRGKGRVATGGSSYQERGTAVAEDDDDEEWDIEKAVEKRLVQVMFTVPREPLRVVNAEPDAESGKDVAVAVTSQEADREQDITESHQAPVVAVEEHDLGTLLLSPIEDEDDDIRLAEAREAEQQILREVGEELDAEWKRSAAERGRQPPATPTHRTPVSLREEGLRLLGAAAPGSESRKRKPSRSPVVDPDGDVFSAQAVRLERPRTKVLAMVESLESLHKKSHESSPAVSPTR